MNAASLFAQPATGCDAIDEEKNMLVAFEIKIAVALCANDEEKYVLVTSEMKTAAK